MKIKLDELLKSTAGAVHDVETTLDSAPADQKKAAAMAALGDAVDVAVESAPEQKQKEVKGAIGASVDAIVEVHSALKPSNGSKAESGDKSKSG